MSQMETAISGGFGASDHRHGRPGLRPQRESGSDSMNRPTDPRHHALTLRQEFETADHEQDVESINPFGILDCETSSAPGRLAELEGTVEVVTTVSNPGGYQSFGGVKHKTALLVDVSADGRGRRLSVHSMELREVLIEHQAKPGFGLGRNESIVNPQ